MKVFERVIYALTGSPEDCSTAWVEDGRVVGFRSVDAGMKREKRAAEAMDTKGAQTEIEDRILKFGRECGD